MREVRTKPCRRCGGSGREVDWRSIGTKIREAREAKGWGVRELARRAKVSPAYISDMEYGRRGGGLSGKGTQRVLKLLGLLQEYVLGANQGAP